MSCARLVPSGAPANWIRTSRMASESCLMTSSNLPSEFWKVTFHGPLFTRRLSIQLKPTTYKIRDRTKAATKVFQAPGDLVMTANSGRMKAGGADRIRTCDLLIANETLYQLSYDP